MRLDLYDILENTNYLKVYNNIQAKKLYNYYNLQS